MDARPQQRAADGDGSHGTADRRFRSRNPGLLRRLREAPSRPDGSADLHQGTAKPLHKGREDDPCTALASNFPMFKR